MAAETDISPDIGGKHRSRHPDRAIAALASRQHGRVTRAQLLELGLGSRAIEHRLESGRLHRVHRGVYAVGHRVATRDGTFMAAVLAGGPGALLSHRSAAALWGIRMTDRTRVDVTVAIWRRSRPGLAFHHARPADDERTQHRGIAVTAPARTLLDLAAVLTPHRLERAIDEAEVLRLADHVPLAALAERHAGRRGVAALRRLLAEGRIGATVTRSELEDRFLAFLDRHGLERPALNARLGPYEVDALWPAQRVVAELDGFAAHGTRAAFERDRARDRALQAAGHRVLRITWRQLATDADAVAADLEALLRGG